MTTCDHIVFIVDDDERIREALGELLESHGMRAMAFGSARDYIEARKPDLPACLVLDVELPDINGLELQGQIADDDHSPIVFITGHGDIPSSVRAIKHGAVDFLTKPFSETVVMNAIRVLAERGQALESAMLVLLERLSPMERAAYLLREAFGCSYRHIARVVRVSEENSRQLVTRARKHLADRPPVAAPVSDPRRITVAFVEATQTGDLARLEAVLSADIVDSLAANATKRRVALSKRTRSGGLSG